MSRSSRSPRAGRARRAGSVAVSLVQLLCAFALALGVLALLASRSGRLRTVEYVADDRIGVLVDHRTGELRPIEQAGYRFVLPGLQAMRTLERAPVEFRMQGGRRLGDDAVPYLVVGARDGSRLWFDSVVIQYQMDAVHAARALTDTGPGEGSRGAFVDAYARPVLAEEFGRFSAGEIVQPENRRAAVERAQARLVELLAAHGIALREISVSRPRFEDRYEQTIERRKVAEQEIGRLVLEAEQLVEGQAAEERRFERKLELQLAKDSDQWARELQDLRHAEQLLAAGRAAELERLARHAGEARTFGDLARALEISGEAGVRSALVEVLGGVELQLESPARERDELAREREGAAQPRPAARR